METYHPQTLTVSTQTKEIIKTPIQPKISVGNLQNQDHLSDLPIKMAAIDLSVYYGSFKALNNILICNQYFKVKSLFSLN